MFFRGRWRASPTRKAVQVEIGSETQAASQGPAAHCDGRGMEWELPHALSWHPAKVDDAERIGTAQLSCSGLARGFLTDPNRSIPGLYRWASASATAFSSGSPLRPVAIRLPSGPIRKVE